MAMEGVFLQLGLSLLLGLLIGLQREHAAAGLAGMRTFPLVTLLGTVLALLAQRGAAGQWLLGAGLLSVMALAIVSHWLRLQDRNGQRGLTTDAALLAAYAVGALLAFDGFTGPAVAVGGTVAVLLQFKPELHRLARTLGDDDLRAIMQFVLITCIVLPVLPDDPIDPFGVIRPWNVWLMVVLIVGISLAGYIVYRFFGANAGILLGGLLGGAVSSTATTVTYSRMARGDPAAAQAAAVVVLLASGVMYVRVLVESAVVAPEFAKTLAAPALIVLAVTVLLALVLWRQIGRSAGRPPAPLQSALTMRQTETAAPAEAADQPPAAVAAVNRPEHAGPAADESSAEKPVAAPTAPAPTHSNPTQLRPALLFGAAYAIVLLALAWTKQSLGNAGMFTVAGLSGLTEVDALTLSTARMALEHQTIMADGWRLVLFGTLTNFASKAAIAAALGGRQFGTRIFLCFLPPTAIGAALLLWW